MEVLAQNNKTALTEQREQNSNVC